MLQQALLEPGSPIATPSAAGSSSYWDGWHSGHGSPWQWPGPHRSGEYWIEQSQDILANMQTEYWNGTYWPDTIQWIGALIDNIVASTERTFTTAVTEYGSDGPGTDVSAAGLQHDIRKYFHHIEAYFGGEDAVQAFDAAYDDAQWVVLEWLEAIRFIKQYDAYAKSPYGQRHIAAFAHRAHIFYNIVQDRFDTSLCGGGLTWDPAKSTYKNAITNELFVSSSIAMYLYFPGDANADPYPDPDYAAVTNKTLPPLPILVAHDPLLLRNAKEEWSWFRSRNFTNAQGLVVDGFHVSDGQTTCDDRNEMVYSYNQAVMLSGLRGLWEATGDTSYLEDGYALIKVVIDATGWNARNYGQASIWAGLGRNGILEDYCDAPATCSQDNLIFKGAYFEHLALFCEPLPIEVPLVPGITYLASVELANRHMRQCQSYAPWVQHNAHAALSTRNATSNIIGQWWGASYVNKTQGPWPSWAPEKPHGSIDIANQPWLLSSAPWECNGQHGCRRDGNGKRAAKLLEARRREKRLSRDQVRTVETQAQGLSVVKAAANLAMGKKAYTESP